MAKVQSEGLVTIDGKTLNLKDYDDTRSWSKAGKDSGFYGHMTVEKARKGRKVKIFGMGGNECG